MSEETPSPPANKGSFDAASSNQRRDGRKIMPLRRRPSPHSAPATSSPSPPPLEPARQNVARAPSAERPQTPVFRWGPPSSQSFSVNITPPISSSGSDPFLVGGLPASFLGSRAPKSQSPIGNEPSSSIGSNPSLLELQLASDTATSKSSLDAQPTDTALGHPPAVFQFNAGWYHKPQNVESTDFSFRSLHNITPVPSPATSPQRLPEPVRTRSASATLLSPFRVAEETRRSTSEAFSSAQIPSTDRKTESSPALISTLAKPNPSNPDQGESSHARRISGISVVSDEDASAQSYDVRDEATPPHRFFSPEFQGLLEQGLDVARRTVAAIEKFGTPVVTDKTLQTLLGDAKRISNFHGTDTRTIAVLGDSGEGKSSLINSLLDYPELAKTLDTGYACTSVVTEYRQRTSEHTAPITIEVEYLSSGKIEEAVAELLWSYRQFYLPEVSSDTTSAQQYIQYERESEQAWSALEAAFQHCHGFNANDLRDMSEGASERIKNQVLQWSREIEWPEGGLNGLWRSTAETADECCEKTNLFMRDKLWPFTKVIRVYLNAQVLKTGVILADLPGLQDTNLARVRATEDYLLRCSNIFIVAKISRAVTDKSLKSSLFSAISRHVPLEWDTSAASSLNIAVVCTKSEDINIDTARREFVGPGKIIEPHTLKELEERIAEAKEVGNRTLKRELKQKRELLFINARNQHVTEGLQNAYAAKVENRNLDVFCVSNRLYKKHSPKGNMSGIIASGIPNLRRFCHGITAEAQLREAEHFLQSSLFSLLNSLHIWATSSVNTPENGRKENANITDAISKELVQIKTQWTEEVLKLGQEFNSSFKESLLPFLDQRKKKWDDNAIANASRWNKWHWTQYRAWCVNNGNHASDKRDAENWNEKIMWKPRMEMSGQWDVVEGEVPEAFQTLTTSVKNLLKGLSKTVEGQSLQASASSQLSGIRSRVKDFEYRISLSQARFASGFKLARLYASETNSSSYLLQEMTPVYRSAIYQRGPGMKGRMTSIVEGRLGDGTLFPNIFIKLQDSMDSLIQETERELLNIMTDIAERIQSDFKSLKPKPKQSAVEDSNAKDFLKVVDELKEQAEAIGEKSAEAVGGGGGIRLP